MATKRKPVQPPKDEAEELLRVETVADAATEPDKFEEVDEVDDIFGVDEPAPAPAATTEETAEPAKPAARGRLIPRANNTAQAKTVQVVRPDVHAARPRPTVNLDNRQLTKKQKHQLSDWRGKNRGRAVDGFFKGQLEAARKKFGHGAVIAGSEMANLVIGIPTPSLAFEFLIGQDCFPLGLILQLNGPPGSNKSALLAEFFRWFKVAGGGGNLLENETKLSPDLFPSIVGRENFPVIVDRCTSVEDWMHRMTYWIKSHKDSLTGTKEDPGPGRTVPILMGVDSIMGKASIETQEKVAESGAPERAFPVEALKITTYMKTVPQWIDGWPFAIVLNNHVKAGKDDSGHDIRRKAGGEGVSFQESFELETRVRKSKIECAEWSGVEISIKCFKNSFGAGQREVWTRMLWWEELNEAATAKAGHEVWEQKTVWDWHWATVKLLTNIKGREAAKLKECFHIKATKTSDVENAAWSSTLGMKEKDAVPWAELGRMISERQDIMDMIRTALGIKRKPLLEGDYLQQLEDLKVQLP